MKEWNEVVLDKIYGLCTVVEANDKESNKLNLAPASHGFVNLFHGNECVAWCGVRYAEENIWRIN